MKPFLLLMLLISSTTLFSCIKPPAATTKLTVAVSLPPQKFFVNKIADTLINVLVMVPPGSSAHTFEPKPAQMATLATVKAYFSIGIEFEQAWLKRLSETYPQLRVIPTDSGITKLSREHDHHAGCNHGLDPHIWLSPELVKKQVQTITDALCALDANNAPHFRKNSALFLLEIDSLQNEIIRMLSTRTNNTPFLVFHPAWGYFANEFGLTELSIEIDGKEPSPRELSEIIDRVKKDRISAIFIQPQYSDQTSKIISASVGIPIAVADPQKEDWIENLRDFATVLGKK